MRSTLYALVLTCLLVLVAGWTKEDHEIFRLRDEIEVAQGKEVNFYELLGITQSTSHDDIGKAFRKKSRHFHPDKAKQNFLASRAQAKSKDGKPKVNKRPSEREIKVAVKEAQAIYTHMTLAKTILTGPSRERYNHFLRNGFPTWRSSGYYYSRYRPGLAVTLLGLWLFTGGAVHYGILVMGHKQQQKFVERTIRRARKAAWGDESATAGIPGLDTVGQTVSATSAAAPAEEEGAEEEGRAEPRNRKERRMMEKQAAKEGKTSKGPVSQKKAAAKAAAEAPPERKKRVIAENGKALLVSSSGSVWIEEEDNDGNTEQYLLDPADLPPPSLQQTALFRAPVWAYMVLKKKLTGKATEEEELEIEELSPDHAAEEIKDAVEANRGGALSAAKKRSKKRG